MVTSSEGKEGVYRADAAHAGKPDAVYCVVIVSFLVNMAHLQEIRLGGLMGRQS